MLNHVFKKGAVANSRHARIMNRYTGLGRTSAEKACAHWSHAPMLQQTLETLEREFNDDNDACIDAAKALVECACRVIIENLDDPANPIKDWPDSPIRNSHPSFNDWVSAAVRLLKISESRDDPFNKVLSQHFKLTETLGKFRDLAGPVSHGKQGFSSKFSVHHKRAALLAADSLVTFLHEAYLEQEPDPKLSLEPYDRFPEANETIDHFAAIQAETDEDGLLNAKVLPLGGDEISLTIEPSRLLFGVDREAYKLALNTCREAMAMEPPDPDDEEAA